MLELEQGTENAKVTRGGRGRKRRSTPRHDIRPACLSCSRYMESMGRRWRCRSCQRTVSKSRRRPRKCRRLIVGSGAPRVVESGTRGYRVSQDDETGRWRVQLGKGHPYANSGGWQYLYRALVMFALDRPLAPQEQVHHVDEDRENDRLENLLVVIPPPGVYREQWNHHGWRNPWTVAEWSDAEGRFVEHVEPVPF